MLDMSKNCIITERDVEKTCMLNLLPRISAKENNYRRWFRVVFNSLPNHVKNENENNFKALCKIFVNNYIEL